MILNEDSDDVPYTARAIAATTFPPELRQVAAAVGAAREPRLAYIGCGDQATTALYAALLTNEATGIAAEVYVGESFRDSLLRRANSQLTAVLFGSRNVLNAALQAAASEPTAAASNLIVIGGSNVAGATYIPSPISHVSAQVAHAAAVAEDFVSALAAEI